MVGDEASAEGLVILDDRLGMGNTDGVGLLFRAGVEILYKRNCDARSRSPSQCTYLVVRDCVSKRTSQVAVSSVVSPITFSIAATRILSIGCGFQRVSADL